MTVVEIVLLSIYSRMARPCHDYHGAKRAVQLAHRSKELKTNLVKVVFEQHDAMFRWIAFELH